MGKSLQARNGRARKRPERPYRRDEWLAAIFQYGRECTAERAWVESKNLAGLYDGLLDAAIADERGRSGNLQAKDRVPTPRWIIDGLLDYIQQTEGQFRVGAGRHTRWLEQYRQARVDFTRFDTVHGLHFNRGLTFDDAYAEAAKRLSGLAGGSARAMEDSYGRVARALKRGAWGRYYGSKYLKIANLAEESAG